MATDTLTTVATFHPAKDFFASRGVIAADMEKELKGLFSEKDFINIPLFQFQVRELLNIMGNWELLDDYEYWSLRCCLS